MAIIRPATTPQQVAAGKAAAPAASQPLVLRMDDDLAAIARRLEKRKR